ncbi:MAG: N-acetyltransferase [Sphingopyxis sp.]|nr:N-acetyltransferase [Sphingopyxis sp.]
MGYQGEADLVAALVAEGDVLSSMVAEEAGTVIGYGLFSQMMIVADGKDWRGAALGPVAVLPAVQARGVGSALIRHGLVGLANDGIQVSFVLGHPHYYPRFGYDAAIAAPFASPYAGPHFMALLLDKSLQIPKSGRADYAAAFAR